MMSFLGTMRKLFSLWPLILLPIAGSQIAFFGWEALEQHRLNSTARPVPATILSAEVFPSGDSSRPVVRFKYQVDEQMHHGERVFPRDETGTEHWAWGVAARFNAGDNVEAWYDPANPRDAFLLRHYFFMPYGFVLFGFCLLGLGPYLAWSLRRSARQKTLRPESDGDWFRLHPPDTLRSASRRFLGLGCCWQIVGAPVWLHFVLHADDLFNNTYALINVGLYVSAGITMLITGFVPWWISRTLGDATVWIDRAAYLPGETIYVRVLQQALRPAAIKYVSVDLCCEQITRVRVNFAPVEQSQTIWKSSDRRLENQLIEAGQYIDEVLELTIPAGGRPTTPPEIKLNPSFRWKLLQVTHVRGLPRCPDAFAIEVLAPADDLSDALEAVEIVAD